MAVDPISIGSQLVEVYGQLQDAMEASELNKRTCKDICDTLISVGPVVAKIASINHVYKASEPGLVVSLNYAFSAFVSAASDACFQMYTFLQHGKMMRMKNATSMKKFLEQSRQIMRSRLDDIHMHISTAMLLNQRDAQKDLLVVAQEVAAIRSLEAAVQGMVVRACSKDLKSVKAFAREQLERQKVVAREQLERRKLIDQQRSTAEGQKLEGFDADVSVVEWSPDGQTLAAGTRKGTVELWRVDWGERVRVMECRSGWVESVAWSADGTMVATESWDGTGCAVWDVTTGDRVRVLQGHTACVNCVAWSPGGDMIATASDDKTAAVWSMNTGERVHVLRGHTSRVWSVAWSPDGEKLATGSSDETAVVWSARTGEKLMVLSGADRIGSVAWSPDGKNLVAQYASQGGTVVFSVPTGQRTLTLEADYIGSSRVSLHMGLKMRAAGLRSGTVRIRNIESGQVVKELKVGTEPVRLLAWSPDGSMFASISGSRREKLSPGTTVVVHHVALE